MKIYPNIPMQFTDDEDGHDPQLSLFWIMKNNNGIEYETGIRALCTICAECNRPLKLYAYYNTIPWTF